jgi:hypothetical protein
VLNVAELQEADLACCPIQLNERHRVTADGLQWIVQKRRKASGRSDWASIIFCQTKAGLMANLGYEVFRGRDARSTCHAQAGIASRAPSARTWMDRSRYRG